MVLVLMLASAVCPAFEGMLAKDVLAFTAGRIVVSDTNRFTCGSGSVPAFRLKAGDEFCGTTVTTTVSYASVLLNERVRVMVDVNFDMFGYRD